MLFVYGRQKEKISSKNQYLVCESFVDKAIRFDCYKTATLYALSHGQTIDDLLILSNTLKSPHLLEHSIGSALLTTSGYDLEKARQKCAPNCLDSYYHAFAEEWARYAPLRVRDFEAFLSTSCPLDEDAKVGCYHNMGHFYLSATEDVDQSLSLCNQYEPNDTFAHCAYGAIHEYFIQFGTDTYFQHCPKLVGRIKTMCYTIGSRLYPQWLSDTMLVNNPLQICDDIYSVIPSIDNHCYRSLAWVLKSLKRERDPSLCTQKNVEVRQFCQKGLASPEGFWGIVGCTITDEHNDESNACAASAH